MLVYEEYFNMSMAICISYITILHFIYPKKPIQRCQNQVGFNKQVLSCISRLNKMEWGYH